MSQRGVKKRGQFCLWISSGYLFSNVLFDDKILPDPLILRSLRILSLLDKTINVLVDFFDLHLLFCGRQFLLL